MIQVRWSEVPRSADHYFGEQKTEVQTIEEY
jgi:hypothetical protein